jgi:hypothetical protein
VLLRRRSGPVLVTLPCVPVATGGGGRIRVGSCTYADACALLPLLPPQAPGATSLSCPLEAGSYTAQGTQQLAMPPSGPPSWLTSVRRLPRNARARARLLSPSTRDRCSHASLV